MLRFIVSLFLLVCISTPIKTAVAVESHAVILMYHRFGEDKYPTTNIKIEHFVQQLDFFADNGFQVWPLSKIISHLQNKTPIPDKTMAITIDDAYLSVYQIAYPIMHDRKIPFTLFVASGVVDKHYSSYMSWQQIQDMVQHGVEVGNHSVNHLHLIEQTGQLESEIITNQQRIEEMTGITTTLFAYPYGEFDMQLADKVKNLNYVGLGQHSGAVGESSDFRFLPRFPVSEQYADMNALRDKIYSLPMPVEEVQPKETITILTQPLLMMTFDKSLQAKNRLHCFASGQGKTNLRWISETRVAIQAKEPLTIRRSRYNCTLKDRVSDRYFWYSHMWLRPEIPEP